MPTLGPFRALRYDPAVVGDLSDVISPPYDVISRPERARLLARHPRNIVRIELPVFGADEIGSDAADPYRAAADTLHAWRQDGTLQVDQQPSLYVYEQRYHLPGDPSDGPARIQRGFFARLHLEPFGEGVWPHERTLSAPKEDRLRLLRATKTDTSPIVVLSDDRAGRPAEILAGIAAEPPMVEAIDDEGTRHRIWALAEESAARELIAGAQRRPLTIADGHHRYETALRYRDERRSERSAGLDKQRARDRDRAFDAAPFGEEGFDHVFALVLDAAASSNEGGPTILPTHRLLAEELVPGELLAERVERYFTVAARDPDELMREFSPPFDGDALGHFGLLIGDTAYDLEVRPDAVAPLFPANVPAVVRALDSAVLEAVLGASVADPRLSYTHDAGEARRAVESGEAAAAVLLRPTSVADVVRVAAAGALMPQKSTYFYPKAATGLVMNPLG